MGSIDFEAIAGMVSDIMGHEDTSWCVCPTVSSNSPLEDSEVERTDYIAFHGLLSIVADYRDDEIDVLKRELQSLGSLEAIASSQSIEQMNMIVRRLPDSIGVATVGRLITVLEYINHGGKWNESLNLRNIIDQNKLSRTANTSAANSAATSSSNEYSRHSFTANASDANSAAQSFSSTGLSTQW